MDATIISASLDTKEIDKAVGALISTIDTKMGEVSTKLDTKLGEVQNKINSFSSGIKQMSRDIKQDFSEMGQVFDGFLKAMERSQKSSGVGSGKRPFMTGETQEYEADTIGALKQEIKEINAQIDLEKLHTEELQEQVNLLRQREKLLKAQTTSSEEIANKIVKERIGNAISMPMNRLDDAYARLQKLQTIKVDWESFMSEKQLNQVNNAIDKTEAKIERLKKTISTNPNEELTLLKVKGFPEKSYDQIIAKMKALKKIETEDIEVKKQITAEYQRLSLEAKKWSGIATSAIENVTKQNSALARSFNYIRNRVVYALTIGSITSFVKQIYEIRAQYELLERSIGVLVNSFTHGSQIFQELNEMALKSPFTLVELGTAAKQLTAYNFSAKEVVNTTRRLADISAALGVPMERLTYNLGQIRAQTVLTARDARDFANAGLPIVKSLADYYSELEGRVISTGDVFDMMKKRLVSYNDVMTVLNQMTDEGGRFFDFQAKQAETLKVQLANLSLAWNNMLNDIGKSHQGLLGAPISILKSLFNSWREVSNALTGVIAVLGLTRTALATVNYFVGASITLLDRSILADKKKIASELQKKAMTTDLTEAENSLLATQKKVTEADYMAALSAKSLTKDQAMLMLKLNKNNEALKGAIINLGLLNEAEIASANSTKTLILMWNVLKATALRLASAFFMNPFTWLIAAGTLIGGIIGTIKDAREQIVELNKAIADSANESVNSIKKTLEEYSNVYNKNIGRWSSAAYKDNSSKSQREDDVKIWKRIKDEINNSSAASDTFIYRLEKISNLGNRISKGFDILRTINDANGALAEIDKTAIQINADWSKWWNLMAGPDGLIDNLKDYRSELEDIQTTNDKPLWKTAMSTVGLGDIVDFSDTSDVDEAKKRFVNDLEDTIESMYNVFTSAGIQSAEGLREALNRTNQLINQSGEMSAKERLLFNMQAEERFIEYKTKLFDDEANWERSRGNETRARIVEDEKAAWVESFGTSESVVNAFFEWLTNQHSREVAKMFGNLSKDEIKNLDISEQRWLKWATDNASSFLGQMNISLDHIQEIINDKDRWQLYIQTHIVGDGDTSIYDALTQADKDLEQANKEAERLKAHLENLRKEGKALSEEYNKTQDEIDTAEKNAADARSRGGREKDKKKGGKKADPILSALKDEISLVKKLQSEYDKLTKKGATQSEALESITSAYGHTLDLLNKDLQSFGLPKLDLSIITGKNPHEVLSFFEKLRDILNSKGLSNLERMKAVEGVIEEFKVSVKEYNLDKVTKGLNNELGKLKEEYELAVELDANPELGGIFADMMGLSKDEIKNLPRTYSQLAVKIQDSIDKVFDGNNIEGKIDITKMLNKEDFDKWAKERGNEIDDAFIESINKVREYLNKVRLDEAEETIKNWSNLVEKYGNIQDRVLKIYKDTVKEQVDVIRQFGNEKDVINAIDIADKINVSNSPEQIARLQKELAELIAKVTEGKDTAISINAAIEKEGSKSKAKAIWDDFKNSDEYAQMFDNLEYLSTSSIQHILDKLEELKDKVKEDPASMKAYFDQLQTARDALVKANPFKGASEGFKLATEGIKEYFSAINKSGTIKKDLNEAKEELALAKQSVVEAIQEYGKFQDKPNADIDARLKAQNKLNNARKAEEDAQRKVNTLTEQQTNNENKLAVSIKKIKGGLDLAKKGGENLANRLGDLSGALSSIGDMFRAFGDDDTADAINDINTGFQVMQSVIMAVVGVIIILEATASPMLVAMTALVGLFIGIAALFSGAQNRAINREIEKSEASVRKLELAYKDLEAAIKYAYGAEEYGLKQAELANKKLQLAEIKRQLELERSRTGKHYDQEKVDEYIAKEKDLENEIAEMTHNIVEELLGISSVGDAAEELVSSMIDAFRKGEDYMANYEETFEKMINNMIVQAIASRVIGDRLQQIWDVVDANINARTEGANADIAKYTQAITEDEKNYDNALQEYNRIKDASWLISDEQKQVAKKQMEFYKQQLEADKNALAAAILAAEEAGRITPADVDSIRTRWEGFKDGVMSDFEALMEAFDIHRGDLAEAENMSNLQQGIQGITEDTAGALEAMLNGISQQVYGHTALLTEIRDIIHTFDFDVQLGVQGEMLLQLQNGHQTMMAMKTMMENWQTPSGNGIRVEML